MRTDPNSNLSTARPFWTGGIASIVLKLLRAEVVLSPATRQTIARESAIVCANHVSLLDGVLIALASPTQLLFAVDTDYARRSPAARAGLAFLSALGFGTIIPLDSSSPHGIRALARTLQSGRSVMVFPEGRISEDGGPLPWQAGLEWLVARTGAKVVQLNISGAERSRYFAKNGSAIWPRIRITG